MFKKIMLYYQKHLQTAVDIQYRKHVLCYVAGWCKGIIKNLLELTHKRNPSRNPQKLAKNEHAISLRRPGKGSNTFLCLGLMRRVTQVPSNAPLKQITLLEPKPRLFV